MVCPLKHSSHQLRAYQSAASSKTGAGNVAVGVHAERDVVAMSRSTGTMRLLVESNGGFSEGGGEYGY
jgi:hypothetical protein